MALYCRPLSGARDALADTLKVIQHRRVGVNRERDGVAILASDN